jgi:5-hydroxyisourate hydrolase
MQAARPGGKIRGVSVSLSTHVLDVEHGRPARGVRVELWQEELLLTFGETDDDGRIAQLAADIEPGTYRVLFRPDSPFFQGVSLELALEDGHYHVPLLVSSYSCTTYRGS